MFRDADRLKAILLDPDRPVQIVIAGKAHPARRRQAIHAGDGPVHRRSEDPAPDRARPSAAPGRRPGADRVWVRCRRANTDKREPPGAGPLVTTQSKQLRRVRPPRPGTHRRRSRRTRAGVPSFVSSELDGTPEREAHRPGTAAGSSRGPTGTRRAPCRTARRCGVTAETSSCRSSASSRSNRSCSSSSGVAVPARRCERGRSPRVAALQSRNTSPRKVNHRPALRAGADVELLLAVQRGQHQVGSERSGVNRHQAP